MTHPKIAIVSRNLGDKGGSEEFARILAEGVAERGEFEVHVFSSFDYQAPKRIHFHRLPQPWGPRILQKPLFAFFASQALGKHRFDLIHTHDPLWYGPEVITYGLPHEVWLRQVRQKRWIGPADWVTIRMEQAMLQHPRVRAVLPMSSLVQRSLVQAYPSLETRLHLLHPGVSDHFLALEDRARLRREKRTQQGVSDSQKVILFVGNNFKHKGLDLVLEAMAFLATQGHQPCLWVLGHGPIDRYRRVVAKLGLTSQVTFFGKVSGDLKPWYCAADLFALPSAYETFGMSVLEAAALGLPIVMTPHMGVKDLLGSSPSIGMLSNQPTPQEMADQLRRLWQDRDQHSGAIQLDNLRWSHVIERMAQIYQQLL